MKMKNIMPDVTTFGVVAFRGFRLKIWMIVGAVLLVILLLLITPFYAGLKAEGKIYSAAKVPKHDVAIVFGAGVYPDGTPTPYLQSRLLMGIKLYQTGKAHALIMSGDNRTSHYDEPTAMKKFVMEHGVPADKIVLDYAGYDTYDTCYRVHNLFGVNSAILVTHGYHLPRALFTCNDLGIKSVGVKADRPGSSYSKLYILREVFSINKATVQLLFKPKPAVLGPKLNAVPAALASAN